MISFSNSDHGLKIVWIMSKINLKYLNKKDKKHIYSIIKSKKILSTKLINCLQKLVICTKLN